MATSKKKLRHADADQEIQKEEDVDSLPENDVDDNSSEADNESDSESEEDEIIDENVNVEFEARNPEEEDFHGLRQLLLQLFLKANIDVSGMVNLILTQRYVGSVIKQYFDAGESDGDSDDDDDQNNVFGVITCFNLSDTKGENCLNQLKEYLIQKISCDEEHCKKLKTMLEDTSNSVGFLVNERYVNIPPQIALPSFNSLCKEMETARQKGENFRFTHYIMVAKKYTIKLNQGGKKRKKATDEPVIYTNAEEELFAERAIFKCTYSVAGERDTNATKNWAGEEDDQYEPLREVIIIKAEDLPVVLTDMQKELGATQTT